MESKESKTIHFFETDSPYGEFSNFYLAPITIKEKKWSTTEHYFQAMKQEGTKMEETIRKASTPKEAAELGRKRDPAYPLRKDWEDVKIDIMYEALMAKFTQYEDLRKVLVGTGNAELVEHTKYDAFWGDGGNGSGRNELGKLLMRLRDELKEKK